jgi:hypothetical protein
VLMIFGTREKWEIASRLSLVVDFASDGDMYEGRIAGGFHR